MKNKFLSWKKIKIEDKEYYVIVKDRTLVSVSYLPKILSNLKVSVLHTIHNNYHGDIVWFNKKNLICFPSEEDVKGAAEYLISIMTMDKL